MIKKRVLFIIIFLFVVVYQCVNPVCVVFGERTLMKNVIDWGYQLQGYEEGMRPINDSEFDLMVIDYSFFGEAADEFSVEDLDELKFNGACKRKIVLAYMSIGEAEEFRFYFDDMPKELLFDEPNPQFPDNIKVRFWEDEWQRIIFGNSEDGPDKSYLDRIIDAGFDGVYLDIIDAYEFWGPDNIGGNGERVTAARDMVDFVIAIADYAREVKGKSDFIVMPQNGSGIIDSDAYFFADDPEFEAERQQKRYFSSIDAIGAEDTFYFGDKENNNSLDIQTDTIDLLNIFREAGKKVLVVDYVQSADKIDIFYDLAGEQGYVAYATIRDLDALTINDSHEPVCNDKLLEAPTPTPDDNMTPVSTPKSTETPIILPLPSPSPEPTDGKSFTFSCEKDIVDKFGDVDVLLLRVGETVSCNLVIKSESSIPSNSDIEISTILRKGGKASVSVDPQNGTTDANGEMEFTITAINKGIDWIAWAVSDESGNFQFNKGAYDSGSAWGMFVKVVAHQD